MKTGSRIRTASSRLLAVFGREERLTPDFADAPVFGLRPRKDRTAPLMTDPTAETMSGQRLDPNTPTPVSRIQPQTRISSHPPARASHSRSSSSVILLLKPTRIAIRQ